MERPKIKIEKPPVWDNACAAFQINPAKTVFTYGDTIYNPGNIDIPDDLIVHEMVHINQQNGNDDDAALWWGKYLRDPRFRLLQETEAYAKQYAFICKTTKDREKRNRVLHNIATILSGPLYGHCVGATEAMLLVKQRAGI